MTGYRFFVMLWSVTGHSVASLLPRKKYAFFILHAFHTKCYHICMCTCHGILYPPCTANQSFKSSFAGNLTTSLRSIPELSEAFACLCKLNFKLPGSNFFLGLKVCKKFELFCVTHFIFIHYKKELPRHWYISVSLLVIVQCINVLARGK